MMKLKPVIHDLPTQLWCGPHAVAAVTGLPTSHIVNEMKEWRSSKKQSKRIIATTAEDLIMTFHSFGYRMRPITTYSERGPSLREWLDAVQRERDRAYILMVQYPKELHWVTVARHWFTDTYTEKPVHVRHAPYPDAKLLTSYFVSRMTH